MFKTRFCFENILPGIEALDFNGLWTGPINLYVHSDFCGFSTEGGTGIKNISLIKALSPAIHGTQIQLCFLQHLAGHSLII